MSDLKEFLSNNMRMLREGRVPKQIADYRLTVCTGVNKQGTQVTEECVHYTGSTKIKGDGKCKACNCGTPIISQMRMKVYYPMACPIGRFSERAGRKLNVNTSSTWSQPETAEGERARFNNENPSGGWPPSERI